MANYKRGTVPLSVAAKVLRVDNQTLRLLLQNKLVDFGVAFKRPGSRQFSYLIFVEPFFRLTGYRYSGSASDQSLPIVGENQGEERCDKNYFKAIAACVTVKEPDS